MKPSLWDYLREAFNARPIGMFFAPNWAMLAGFGLAGYLHDPGWLVLGTGVELGYLLLLGTNARFQRFVAGKLSAGGSRRGRAALAAAGRLAPRRSTSGATRRWRSAARRSSSSSSTATRRRPASPRRATASASSPGCTSACWSRGRGSSACCAKAAPGPRRSAAGARHGRTGHVRVGAREAARRAEAAAGRPVDRRRSAPQPGRPGRPPRAARRPARRGRSEARLPRRGAGPHRGAGRADPRAGGALDRSRSPVAANRRDQRHARHAPASGSPISRRRSARWTT